jgi:hypothetical protein
MNLDNEKEPVLVVLNKSRKLVHAGHPETFNKKLLGEYAKEGYQIKTITIKKYRETKWTWHWE